MYTEAIFCKVPPKKKAIYLCNRSLTNIKQDNYAIALFDAKDCIKNDPTYVKGYYRRGSAYVALGQLDLAVKDFKQVCKLVPQDKDAREKYEVTLKEHKLKEFSKCIGGYDDAAVVVKPEDIIVESSYTGPRLDEEKGTDSITHEWVVNLMNYLRD